MLLKSRKFWLTLFDIVISTATYFITKYINPEIGNDILWLIGAWQPVIIMLIAGIAIEDSARFKADGAVASAEIASGNG
jgi:hypothetical protein